MWREVDEMRNFTVLITPGSDQRSYEAVTVDLPLPVITGRSLAEVQDNLLTAIQRHIDWACEAEAIPDTAGKGRPDQAAIALRADRVQRGQGLRLEIPEYLFTRN
ncbi:MAG: hypothetical protein QME79_09860 [Bacillota bacterium]|nr:hypothetical protein [Bacillota bacterium]